MMARSCRAWVGVMAASAVVFITLTSDLAQAASSRRSGRPSRGAQCTVTITGVEGHKPITNAGVAVAGSVVARGEVTGTTAGQPAGTHIYILVRNIDRKAGRWERWRVQLPEAVVSQDAWTAGDVLFSVSSAPYSRCEIMAVVTGIPLRRGHVASANLAAASIAKSSPVLVDYFTPLIRIKRIAGIPAHLNQPIEVSRQEDVEGAASWIPDWAMIRVVIQPANSERRWVQLRPGEPTWGGDWIANAGFGTVLTKDDYLPFDVYAVICDRRLQPDFQSGYTPERWHEFKIFGESTRVRVLRKPLPLDPNQVSRVGLDTVDNQKVDAEQIWRAQKDARITGSVDGRLPLGGAILVVAWDPAGPPDELFVLGLVKPRSPHWEIQSTRLPDHKQLKIMAGVASASLVARIVRGQPPITRVTCFYELWPYSQIVRVQPVDPGVKVND